MAQKRYDFTTQLKTVLCLAVLRPTWVRLGTPVTIHTRQRLASSESLPFGEGRGTQWEWEKGEGCGKG